MEESDDTSVKTTNTLPLWGNKQSMNLNSLVLTNIQNSVYFKKDLYNLKTYHEVGHLEPWEKGSRKTSGQVGMCGAVRGVGTGGIVSTAFCCLYKFYTLRLTRKQLLGLINHTDSPYIRGIGFLYIRFTQPPKDLWNWMRYYLDDEEEVDPRAGGGDPTTMGLLVRQMLTRLDWYCTLFPRIPVPIMKDLEKKLLVRPYTPASQIETQQSKDRYDESHGQSSREVRENHEPRTKYDEILQRESDRQRDNARRRDDDEHKSYERHSKEKVHSRDRSHELERYKRSRSRDGHRHKNGAREHSHKSERHKSSKHSKHKSSRHSSATPEKERTRHRERSPKKKSHRHGSREKRRHGSREHRSSEKRSKAYESRHHRRSWSP